MGIAYLPQQTAIFRGLTVYENLLGIAQIVKKKTAEQIEIVEKLMAEFSITHLRDVKATALSGGERRRTEIARCLISNPKVLLLDEPAAGMNNEETEDIARFILDVHEELGITVVLIDHDMNMVMDIATNVVVMDFGEKLFQGNPQEAAKNQKVIDAYLGVG